MFDQCWSEEYKKNRKAVDKIYSKIRTPRATRNREKTKYVIARLNERIKNNIAITKQVRIEIGMEVDSKFDPEGLNKDKPFSEAAVFKIYTRYVKE